MKYSGLSLLLGVLTSLNLTAQSDSAAEDVRILPITPIYKTFESSRAINLHTIEQPLPGTMEFRVSHRFGALNEDFETFFGLDNANIRLALEYSPTDWVMIGLGRSSQEKVFDGFAKFRVLKQKTYGMPVSLSYFTNMTIDSDRSAPATTDEELEFQSRLAYTHQLIVARKFTERFSFQLSPTYVHRNLVRTTDDENGTIAFGAAGRYKILNNLAVNVEYLYRVPPATESEVYGQTTDMLSIGVDWVTGGHVFQLHLTNGAPMYESGFVTASSGDWSTGDIYFGFNITREFKLHR